MTRMTTGRPSRRGLRVLVLASTVGVVCALGALAGGSWAVLADRQHVATSTIMLHPLEGNAYSPGGRGDDLVNLETEAQVLRSDAVARAVLERLEAPGTAAALLSSVSVVVPPNTQLLEITVTAADEATAVARASAFAEVYLEFRRARTESSIFGRTSRIEELVEVREDERKAALARLAKLSSSAPERRLVEQQVQEVVVQIGSLRAQLATAQAIGLDPGQVVTPGHVVEPGPLASPVVMSVAGGVAGLALCLTLAAARSGRRAATMIRDLDDVADSGIVPLGAVTEPVRSTDDVIARIRSAVLHGGPDRPLVVAVAPLSTGRSATFEPLVASLTRARYEVVAVDLESKVDRAALVELVLAHAAASDVLVEVAEFRSRLQPVQADRRTSGFADLMASAQMRTCLAELAKRADLVVVSSPPLGTPVGRAILQASRTVVIEVASGGSTRVELADVQAEIDRHGGDLCGAVAVRTRRGGKAGRA